jgi:hypothetical protein
MRITLEEAAVMFAPSTWRDERMAEREVAFLGLCPSPMRHILAGWAVTVFISFVALVASVL